MAVPVLDMGDFDSDEPYYVYDDNAYARNIPHTFESIREYVRYNNWSDINATVEFMDFSEKNLCLELSIKHKNLDIVRILLTNIVHSHENDKSDYLPWDRLKSIIKLNILTLRRKIDEPFVVTVLSAIDYFIKRGGNICAKNNSLLRSAIVSENYSVVAKLLEYGADIHCCDNAILENLNYKFDARFINEVLSCCEPLGPFIDTSSHVRACANQMTTFFTRLKQNPSFDGHIRQYCFAELIKELASDEILKQRKPTYDLTHKLKKMFDHKLAKKLAFYSGEGLALMRANIGNIHCKGLSISPWCFDEELANIVLERCASDDYGYFPDWYIREKVVFLKKA